MFLKNAGKDLSVLKGVIVIDGGVSGRGFKEDEYLPAFLFLNTLTTARTRRAAEAA